MTFCTEEPNRPLVGRWNGTEWTRLSPHEEQLAAKQAEIEALTAQLARMKAPVSEERQFFHSILIAEGLSDWSVQSGEAYCYISLKIIKVPEDCVMSLFLHEVAHALYPEPEGEMKNHYHGGNWASTYGNLVNKWMRFDQQLAARAAEPKEAENGK